MSDIDVGSILRIIVFVIAVLLLISGFADLGGANATDVLAALSAVPIAIIKLFVAVILMILAINPDSIGVLIGWQRQD
jgi:Ca2+/H+ antiporter